MHFEILIEDISGKKALDLLVPKILRTGDTYEIHPYKGIGHIPKDLRRSNADPAKRALLNKLPMLLRGYGKKFQSYPEDYKAMLIVVCDLDNRKESVFRTELQGVLDACNPKPNTQFCLAIEEGEAWILGDIDAILKAYPRAKKHVLQEYVNDSICGTWECLANALYPGGAARLIQAGWQAVGREKSLWVDKICPGMDVGKNKSPSFNRFVGVLDSADRA